MIQVCAWCRRELGRVSSCRYGDDELSHGICPDCVSNFTYQKGVPLHEYLESLLQPVLVVDDDVQVLAANASACRVLGREVPDLLMQRGGPVFECAHARLPEGCGRTVHCSGCAIRRAVTTTFETGRPNERVPATLSRKDPDRPSSIARFITTVKAGHRVLLRIEPAG